MISAVSTKVGDSADVAAGDAVVEAEGEVEVGAEDMADVVETAVEVVQTLDPGPWKVGHPPEECLVGDKW